jgi:dipeptidyl aminopeptidase/acylaminoacyl peptidase
MSRQRTARTATRVAIAALLGLTIAPTPQAATRRPIAETDLFSFVWIADPQMAPDGSRVAFLRVAVNRQKEQYEASIWIAGTGAGAAPQPFTSGPRDSSPRWSPDGTRLAFVRAVEADGRVQPPQIYVMAMGGGEPRAVTDIPRGAGAPAWAPDGKAIAFPSSARPDELPGADKAAAKPSSGDGPKRQSDVRVITDAVYRANGIAGAGYVDADRPSQIWVSALPDTGAIATPAQVTSGAFSAGNHQWSPDGNDIYFVSNRQRESYYYPGDSDLYAVSRRGGEPRRVVDIDGPIGPYAFSRDGKRIAFTSGANAKPERSYDQPDLWVAEVAGGAPRNLTTGYDFDIGGGIGGDQRAPRGQHPAAPIWDSTGSRILVRVGEQGNAVLASVDAASGRVDRTIATRDVMSYTADASGRRLAVVISTPTTLGDLHVLDGPAASPTKLTSFNDELFNGLTLTEPEEIWYPSFDGRRIQGWILKPPDFDPQKKYPLILQIHGGPHSAYGNTFTHEFAWMAAKGYVVLYTNPRGSSNYGQEFGNIIQFNYPGDDYKDLMAGVDAVLKKGYIDERQMGVTGGSGGGLLTNWVVTQTTRFKAAVSQRDISDWANFWYTADFTLFTPTWFHKAPFEDPAEFARRSPITYAAQIQTPLMFILGDEDWRTPPSAGGEDLFRALKFLKRPTVMVRFPGESHELSRSGRPWHRVERLQHIVGWFDKYLTGRSTGTYEPQPAR